MTTLAPTIEQTGAGPRRWWILLKWNLSRSLIITRREVIDMFRDWRILIPIIILTMIFPTIANWGAGRMTRWVADYGAEIVGERLIPFLLMVVGFFPTSFSLIIALESFVGEKERRSLEPLLSTPLTNIQLYVGKMLSSTIPPLVGSLLGITVYLIGVYFNIDWKPPLILLVQIILLNIIQASVMVSGAVVVSSQTTSVRAANLLASFIIIPMSFLIQAEAIIMFWAKYETLWLIMLALVVINVVLIRMGARIFNREELLGREIDELNLYGSFKEWVRLTLARRMEGPRRSAWVWYREEVLGTVGRLRGPILLVVIGLVAGYGVGVYLSSVYPIPSDVFIVDDWIEKFSSVLASTGLVGLRGILLVLYQNVRALTAASILAVFSFGVAIILVLMLPAAIIGYLMTHMIAAGIDPIIPWMAVAPHGIFEITGAVIAGAVAVRLGASIISPPPGKTVGEGWMIALSEATRLWFTLVLPLLIMGAVFEVLVTPNLVLLLGGG